MKKHLIVGHFGPKDKPNIAGSSNETVTLVDLFTTDELMHFGISKSLNELEALHIYPTETGLDLLILATLVQLADTRISRELDSQDTWTREFHLVIPVLDVDLWNGCHVLIQRILKFLTGDIWAIEFRKRPDAVADIVHSRSTTEPEPVFDGLSLFSGGLDSLIGVIDMLESGGTPLLVSHAGDGATSDSQRACFQGLSSHYDSRAMARLRHWLNFPKDIVVGSGKDNTTRGRSFLFFAIGAFVGSGFANPFTLKVPENGLIAINVPMDNLRLGSLSTRTTHPFYIARWNELLSQLKIMGRIENPYWNMTKGEMAAGCANQSLLKELAPHSMSCSAPTKGRYHGHAFEHCGYCLPCLIRHAALVMAWGGGGDATPYTINLESQTLDTRRAQGRQVRSLQYAAERLRKNPGLERLLVHIPGSLADVASDVDELAAVYRRGLFEVEKLVASVQAMPS